MEENQRKGGMASFCGESSDREKADETPSRWLSSLRHCAWRDCAATETVSKQFQVCAKCKEMKSNPRKFYCGMPCFALDWRENHKHYHAEERLKMAEEFMCEVV